MLRTGVYTIDQIKRNEINSLFGKIKNFSILLYDDIYGLQSLKEREQYSEILLNRFNSRDNIIKRTYRNRFDDFDNITANYISEMKYDNIRMHDMAISDGRASIFLLRKLIKINPSLEYTASDINLTYTVHFFTDDTYIVTDSKSNVIEITKPPFVWNYERKEKWIYFMNNILKYFFLLKYSNKIKSHNNYKSRTVNLIDFEFAEIMAENGNFKLTNYNLFDKPELRYNVIRAMNILHYGYFTKHQIDRVLENIFCSLDDEGLFVEGSNEDAGTITEGGIYKKTKSGFNTVYRTNKPSRILGQINRFCF